MASRPSERRGLAAPAIKRASTQVRAPAGAFSAPIKSLDAKTREAIERFEKAKGRGR